jgi:hypothetical protein
VDAQACPPEHDDQAAQSASVAAVAGSAHHGDDLLHGWRIGRVPLSFVAWRPAGVESRHRRRRPTTTGGVEHQLGHDPSSGS